MSMNCHSLVCKVNHCLIKWHEVTPDDDFFCVQFTYVKIKSDRYLLIFRDTVTIPSTFCFVPVTLTIYSDGGGVLLIKCFILGNLTEFVMEMVAPLSISLYTFLLTMGLCISPLRIKLGEYGNVNITFLG